MAQIPDIDVTTISIGGSAYTVPFLYQNQAEVFVEVDGVATAFTWINAGNISIVPAPAAGAAVRRYRSTSANAIRHDYRNGVPFTPKNIAENNDQILYVVQEAVGAAIDASDVARSIADTAEQALSTADTALTVANNALAVANGIADTADAALATSASAVATAEAAEATANAIAGTANTAMANSTTAINIANSAANVANDIAGTANAALDVANAAEAAVAGLTPQVQELQKRTAGILHASEAGLLGNGTDETAAIQAAINLAISTNRTLVGDRAKTYKITSQITGSSNCYIRDLNIDASALTGSFKHALVFQGALGSSSALTANVAVNAFTIPVTDGSIFAADEWVLLTVDTSYYPYSTYNVARGEWVQIRSVSGNNINITTPLVQAYTTAAGAKLRKCSFVENVVLDNVRITGSGVANSNERGICFRFARLFDVRNCVFTNLDQYACELSMCIKFWVHHNRFRGTFYDGVTGTIFYAIALVDACQYFTIHDNHGARSRHLVVTTAASSGQGRWGQCMFGVIHSNVAEDCMAGGGGRSYAYEMHGTGQHLLWANNIANGCYSFMRIEGGSDSQVIGGGCNGYAHQGLIIGGSGQTVRNIDIRGVRLHNYTAEVTGGAAIRFESTSVLENITVDGVKITYAAVASVGAAVSIGTSITSRNNRIKNLQASAGSVESTGIAVDMASSVTGFSFDSCDLFGWRNGYNLSTASKIVVRGGTIENFAAGGTGWGFYSNGDRNICKGVHFRNINTSLRLDTASTNNLVVENTITDVIVPTPSNAGVGNVVTPNYTV